MTDKELKYERKKAEALKKAFDKVQSDIFKEMLTGSQPVEKKD